MTCECREEEMRFTNTVTHSVSKIIKDKMNIQCLQFLLSLMASSRNFSVTRFVRARSCVCLCAMRVHIGWRKSSGSNNNNGSKENAEERRSLRWRIFSHSFFLSVRSFFVRCVCVCVANRETIPINLGACVWTIWCVNGCDDAAIGVRVSSAACAALQKHCSYWRALFSFSLLSLSWHRNGSIIKNLP